MEIDRPTPPARTRPSAGRPPRRPTRARADAFRLPALVAALLAAPAAMPVHGGDLRVSVAGVGEHGGEVRVALFADEAAFEARTSFRAATLVASAPTLEFAFADLPPGDYAVLVHHDVDGDGALGRGRFGIPSEPWTGSTAGTRLLAPSWNAYAFDVTARGLSIALEL